MNNKIATIIATAIAATIMLTGCSANENTASGKLDSLKAPQGFSELSKKDNTVIYTSLKNGKNNVSDNDFCGSLFDWSYSNGLTRFRLIDNTFELKDYTKDGEAMGKTAGDNGPWVAACNSNFALINPDNETINKNWDKDIVFFGQSKEGINGSAYVSAGYEGKTKYVKLTVSFKDSK